MICHYVKESEVLEQIRQMDDHKNVPIDVHDNRIENQGPVHLQLLEPLVNQRDEEAYENKAVHIEPLQHQDGEQFVDNGDLNKKANEDDLQRGFQRQREM